MSHPHHPHGQHPGGHPASHGHGGHPETIKETYSRIKDETTGKSAVEYMKNMKNQLRLVFWGDYRRMQPGMRPLPQD